MNNLRFDFIFSYWVFSWFVLYCVSVFVFHIPTKFDFSPILLLWIGLIENIVTLLLILWYNPQPMLVLYFVIMMLSVKISPLYLLRKTKIHWLSQIVFGLIFVTIYLLYLSIWRTNVVSVYTDTIQSLLRGDNRTPMIRLLTNV